jgi:hypothetical protein
MSGEEFPLTIPPAQNPDAQLAVIFGRGARERPEALFQLSRDNQDGDARQSGWESRCGVGGVGRA